MAGEHRALVYDAHGRVERVSVVRHADDDSLFAVNFYRHAHQRALTDGQIAWFAELAPALLALAQKHVVLRGVTRDGIAADLALSLPTVKTYRNRTFTRLGIHFRNALFALVMQRG